MLFVKKKTITTKHVAIIVIALILSYQGVSSKLFIIPCCVLRKLKPRRKQKELKQLSEIDKGTTGVKLRRPS